MKGKLLSTLMQFRLPKTGGFRILMYHSVRPDFEGGSSPYVIEPSRFKEQIEWLARNGCTVLSLFDAVRAVKAGECLPANTVVLSFDDGYRDNLTYVAPILRGYGFKPVVFLCPDLFGTDRARQEDFNPPSPFLTREEARALIEEGWEVGGHTLTHCLLTRCQSEEEIEREVGGCRLALRELCGHDVRFFAYPFGQFDETIKRCVRRSGFELACSALRGFNTGRTDFFELHRIGIYAADTAQEFRNKVCGAHDWLAYFERRAMCKRRKS